MDVDMPMQPPQHDLLPSLAAARKPAARFRLLRSLTVAAGSSDQPTRLVLFEVFLGFTQDPFPLVRQSALDGLVATVCPEQPEVDRCYRRALELFVDVDEVVRAAAVRVVGQYGQVLATSMGEEGKQDQLDEVFVRLCSMARDMSSEVRIEAFTALGKIRPISDDVLLQGLAKKVSLTKTGRKVLSKFTSMEFVSLVASAAGAFMHGLEDELSEVREATCASLGRLAIFSGQFADAGVKLLMDLLNDDNLLVRLQLLDTMFHMALYDQLKVEETHMHMFLSVLIDTNTRVRHSAQKLLRVMKLQNLKSFKLLIEGLLKNLDLYPQDESEILSVVYFLGKNNKSYLAAFVTEHIQQIKPICEGDLILDKPLAKAILLLSLSMSNLTQTFSSNISPMVFDYAVPLLGKLPASIEDAIHRDSLSGHLAQSTESFMSTDSGLSKHIYSCQKDEMVYCMKLTFGLVFKTWHFLKSNHKEEVFRSLRNCKRELSRVGTCKDLIGALEFVYEYIKVLKLFTKVSVHMEPKQLHLKGSGNLYYLLEKLDKCLLRLKYTFIGVSLDVEVHISELMLFTCALKLKVTERYHYPSSKKLRAIVSQLERICHEEKLELSNFAKVIKQLSHENDANLACQIRFSKLLDLISFESLLLNPNLIRMKVELNVTHNDSENPLPFVSGLPVGITFDITFHNVPLTRKLWIHMEVGKLIECSFFDLDRLEGSDEKIKCTVDIPFYGSPDATFFSLFASVSMECPMEKVDFHGEGEPAFDMVNLSNKIEIYLVNVKNKLALNWK